MTNFAKIKYSDGRVETVGSIKGERLDINFCGSYVAIGRGNSCLYKENMADVEQILFINDFSGPDIEMNIRHVPPTEANRLIEEATAQQAVEKNVK